MQEEVKKPDAPAASILSNPALLRSVGELLGNSAPAETGEKTDSPAPPPDLLGSLLSNPAVLERLPQLLATLAPLMQASTAAKTEDAVETAAKPHTPAQDRDQLLVALKPFLSTERCAAVDSILRIAHLGSLLGQLK